MKKNFFTSYVCLLIIAFSFIGCGNKNNVDMPVESSEDSKQWLSQATTLTDLQKYPCEYLINLDSINLGMNPDEVFNILASTGISYEVTLQDNDYWVLSSTHNGYDVTITIFTKDTFEGYVLNCIDLEYSNLSHEHALDILHQLEAYYENLSTSSRVFEDSSLYGRKVGYLGNDFAVYVSARDSDWGDEIEDENTFCVHINAIFHAGIKVKIVIIRSAKSHNWQ